MPTRRRRATYGWVVGVLSVGVLAVPLVFFTSNSDVFTRPKAFVSYVVSGIAVAALLVTMPRDRTRLGRVASWLVIALIGFETLAFAFSPDKTLSWLGEPLRRQGLLATYAYLAAFTAARFGVKDRRRALAIYWAMSVAAVVSSLYGLAQLIDLDPVWDILVDGRIFSTFGQPNWLGAFLVMALPLVVVTALDRSSWMRWTGLIGAGIVIGALAATQSRSAALALAAIALGGVVLLPRTQRKAAFTYGGAVAAVLVVAILVIPPTRDSVSSLVDRTTSPSEADSLSTRIRGDLWRVGWEMAADNALVGVGQDRYPDEFEPYRVTYIDPFRADFLTDYRPEGPHNAILARAATAGWPAALAFVGLIVITLYKLVSGLGVARRRDRLLMAGLILALVAHVITDLFVSLEPGGTWLFWVLLGVGWGAWAPVRAVPGNVGS